MGIFNHSSWVDAIIMMWLFAPSGVSLASNANLPLVGTCIRAFQNIYVPRASHGTAANTDPASTESLNGAAPTVSDLIAERYHCIRLAAADTSLTIKTMLLLLAAACAHLQIRRY